jgi:rod shape-determining protein MreD
MDFAGPLILQRLLPWLLTLLLAVLACLPGTMPVLGAVMPPLALIPLFYFSIHRPDWFGPVSAFIIGLLVDTLLGAPLGVTAGLYAVMQLLLQQQQRFFKSAPFHVLWVGYAFTQLVVTMVQSAAWWALAGVTPQPLALLGMNVLGMAVFPPLSALCARLQKWLAR